MALQRVQSSTCTTGGKCLWYLTWLTSKSRIMFLVKNVQVHNKIHGYKIKCFYKIDIFKNEMLTKCKAFFVDNSIISVGANCKVFDLKLPSLTCQRATYAGHNSKIAS